MLHLRHARARAGSELDVGEWGIGAWGAEATPRSVMTGRIATGQRRTSSLGLPIILASISLLSAGASAAIEVGFVTAKSLNVRDAPNGDVVDSLATGATVLVHDTKSGWLQVTYIRKKGGMGKGWVSAQFVKLGSAPGTRTKRERAPRRGNCDTEYKTGAEV